MSTNAILGPYIIEADTLEKQSEHVFKDMSKTRLIAIIQPCNETPVLPSFDAILLKELNNCSNNCIIRWYDCVSTFGRTYTILPTACEVLITSFENGLLLLNSCDNSTFGTETYCYGKIYSSNHIYSSDKNYFVSFELDGHFFSVSGNVVKDYDVFDCSFCNNSIQEFSTVLQETEGRGELPTAPIEAETVFTENSIQNQILGANPTEERVNWNINFPESSGTDTICQAEIELKSKESCESQNNPSITILQNGQILIAYEERMTDGTNKISIAATTGSKNNKIYYYRNLSFGCLLNNSDFVYGSGKFEIFDDIVFSLTVDNQPKDQLYIGFLTGPLKGNNFFSITQIERSVITGDKFKYIISFDSASTTPDFLDSNDVCNVKFVIVQSNNSLPKHIDLITSITAHTDIFGAPVPVANPSIHCATNNLMIDGSQNIFLSYQAFENNIWNVYVRHFKINDNDAVLPIYNPPYNNFLPPIFGKNNLQNGDKIVYKVQDKIETDQMLSVLFYAFAEDGVQIVNCFDNPGQFNHPGGHTVNNQIATIEAVFSFLSCPRSYLPDFYIGQEFTGSFPPNITKFVNPDFSCMTSASINPSTAIWCKRVATCFQNKIDNDPYCPNPYLLLTYKPEDLWTIKNDDIIVTRVKYHMSVGDSKTDNYGARIVERDKSGYDQTFIKNAEVIITYNDDLSDYWTNDKYRFEFIDNVPSDNTQTKGLVNLPFSTYTSQQIYGIDSVHLNGNIDNWVYFSEPGKITFDFPNVGNSSTEISSPILIDTNSSRPVVKTNNRNEVFLSYETFEYNTSQIKIVGTGDFYQNSITGPKSNRITRLLEKNDFTYYHNITTPAERVNQLCDFLIDSNDITHVVWQSNRDVYWEIYYANSYNLFEPVRLTQSNSRSMFPKIDVDQSGSIYVVYHDDRFGKHQIMLVYKNETRILPLLQQDPYISSLKSAYTHYTNILPITISNPSILSPLPGSIYGVTNTTSGIENALFKINSTNCSILNKCFANYEIICTAGTRSGDFFGIAKNKKLVQIVDIQNNSTGIVNCSSIREIGTIDIRDNSVDGGTTYLTDNFNQTNCNAPDTSKWTLDPTAGFTQRCYGAYQINTDATICNGYLSVCGDDCSCSCSAKRNGDSFAVVGITNKTAVDTDNLRVTAYVKWIRQASNHTFSNPFYISRKKIKNGWPYEFVKLSISKPETTNILTIEFGRAYQDFIILLGQKTFCELENISQLTDAGAINEFLSGNMSKVTVDYIVEDSNLQGLKNITVNVSIGDTLYATRIYANEDPETSLLLGKYINYSTFVNLTSSDFSGEIVLDRIDITGIDPSQSSEVRILDAAIDNVNRLWIAVANRSISNKKSLQLLQIDTTNANIIRTGTAVDNIDTLSGSLSIKQNGIFYVSYIKNGYNQITKSKYPKIQTTNAIFSFSLLANTPVLLYSMTNDDNDNIIGLGYNNTLYYVDSSTGILASICTINDPYLDNDPYVALSNISGIGYLFTGQFQEIGEDSVFNLLIEFYNNKNLDGSPSLIVDSRTNLESFINVSQENSLTNFTAAAGIEIPANTNKTVYFDASHFRPSKTSLSYPYSFSQNQTYFPKIFNITVSGSINSISDVQSVSFSCNKCSQYSDNNIDHNACSHSFILTSSGYFNFVIYIYGDPEYTNIIKQYTAKYNSSDLAYFEVDNIPAAQIWSANGLLNNESSKKYIQLYPTLDPLSGLVCGVNYYIRVFKCIDSDCSQLEELSDFNKTFFCECSSNIFDDKMLNLSQLPVWHSSSYGYSDTRITDTTTNTTRPIIKTRNSGGGIIIFEDTNKSNQTTIKGATFKQSSPNEQFSTGTKSWFDYDFGIQGDRPDISVDVFDKLNTVYQKSDLKNGRGITSNELPTFRVFEKICDISETIKKQQTQDICDISKIENNIITHDEFIFSEIIKKILIKPEYVDYYTYNSNNQTTPVVSDCNIKLLIIGTPESVAFRIRNENNTIFSEWCSFNSEISDYTIEKDWKISGKSGIKQICVQAMTYSGITSEYCIPVIADYSKMLFNIELYEDSQYTKELPKYEEKFVTGLSINKTTQIPYSEMTVFIQIVPNNNIESERISFDIYHQGNINYYDLVATKAIDAKGRIVFRGQFVIKKEDKVNYKDGIAVINPKIPTECDSLYNMAAATKYEKDTFNNIIQDSIQSTQGTTDELSQYREQVSGRIGTGMIIRPSEDPYFIFGSPDFFK